MAYGAFTDVVGRAGRPKPRYPHLHPKHPLANNLVGAWLFNAGVSTGGNYYDSSLRKCMLAFGNNGIGGGSTPPSFTSQPAVITTPWGTALHFNGTSDMLIDASGFNSSINSRFNGVDGAVWMVISTRVRLRSTPTGSVSIARQQSHVDGHGPFAFGVGWDTNHVLPRFWCQNNATDGFDYVEAVTSINDGLWHTVTGLFSGRDSIAHILIDGQLNNSKSLLATGHPINSLNTGPDPLTIGSYLGATSTTTAELWPGDIEYVQIWAQPQGGWAASTSLTHWQELAADPYAHFRTQPAWKLFDVQPPASSTIFWGFEADPQRPIRRSVLAKLATADEEWPFTATPTPTQFGWNVEPQFAERNKPRPSSNIDDQFQFTAVPTPTQFGWNVEPQYIQRNKPRPSSNTDDQFQFTAVPTPTQFGWNVDPQFAKRPKFKPALLDEVIAQVVPGTPTPTQQGFDWNPQFPIRRRFTTFQSSDDEFKFTAVPTPTQFGWNVEPQFAERNKPRFNIYPADDEYLFTAVPTPTQFGWNVEPQFSQRQRFRSTAEIKNDESFIPRIPPTQTAIARFLMLLGVGR